MHIEYSNLFKKFQNSRSSPLFQLSKKMSGIVSPHLLSSPPHHPVHTAILQLGAQIFTVGFFACSRCFFVMGFVDGLSLFVSHTHFYLSPPVPFFSPSTKTKKQQEQKGKRKKKMRSCSTVRRELQSQTLQPRRSRRNQRRRKRAGVLYQSRKKKKKWQISFLVIRRSVRNNLMMTRRYMLLSGMII